MVVARVLMIYPRLKELVMTGITVEETGNVSKKWSPIDPG